VAQIALAWALAQPLNVFTLVGAKTPREIEANVGALEVELTEQELLWLNLG
jgi:aryl-alcohol dehydrogenase-like predicted oxidoreductase